MLVGVRRVLHILWEGCHIGKKYYEVIKFTNRSNICRGTMDYVQGDLLFDLVRKDTYISKEELFYWFDSLITQLVQYHSYSKNRCYRYLYPLSICITRNNELYLLDLEATSNDFVLKNIQTRSMRQHFIKSDNSTSRSNKLSQDLFGLGKTMQFVLAHCNVTPELTRRESRKLSYIIDKCLMEDSKKQYHDFSQIQKESKFLKLSNKQLPNLINSKKTVVLVLIVGVLAAGVITSKTIATKEVHTSGSVAEEIINEKVDSEEDLRDAKKEIQDMEKGSLEAERDAPDAVKDMQIVDDERKTSLIGHENDLEKGDVDLHEAIEIMENEISKLSDLLLENSSLTNHKVIDRGVELELNILRALAMAYDREGFHQDGIKAYARLLEIEVQNEHKETAFIRKMKIESELSLFEQALETGQLGLEQMDYNLGIARTYLEIMIESGIYDASEITKEYERLSSNNSQMKTDSYTLKLLGGIEK